MFSLPSLNLKPSEVPHSPQYGLTAIGELSYQRGLVLPGDLRLLHVLERKRDRAAGALAHAAVAQISVVVVDLSGVADPPAGAAAGHRFGHSHAPLVWRPMRG